MSGIVEAAIRELKKLYRGNTEIVNSRTQPLPPWLQGQRERNGLLEFKSLEEASMELGLDFCREGTLLCCSWCPSENTKRLGDD